MKAKRSVVKKKIDKLDNILSYHCAERKHMNGCFLTFCSSLLVRIRQETSRETTREDDQRNRVRSAVEFRLKSLDEQAIGVVALQHDSRIGPVDAVACLRCVLLDYMYSHPGWGIRISDPIGIQWAPTSSDRNPIAFDNFLSEIYGIPVAQFRRKSVGVGVWPATITSFTSAKTIIRWLYL